jgi:putative pre-16S rRNA nuclease
MNSAVEHGTPRGRILALDLGDKRVGVAVSDELQISISRLSPIVRRNWKQLLNDVVRTVGQQDAKGLVVGFPLSLDGSQGSAAEAAQQTAGRFAQSLSIPVYLQDERLTSVAAGEQLRAAGHNPKKVQEMIDSEAAAVILSDFLGSTEPKTPVSATRR